MERKLLNSLSYLSKNGMVLPHLGLLLAVKVPLKAVRTQVGEVVVQGVANAIVDSKITSHSYKAVPVQSLGLRVSVLYDRVQQEEENLVCFAGPCYKRGCTHGP